MTRANNLSQLLENPFNPFPSAIFPPTDRLHDTEKLEVKDVPEITFFSMLNEAGTESIKKEYPFLRDYQIPSVALSQSMNKYAFFWQKGLGKTLLGTIIAKEKSTQGKVLIVVRKITIRSSGGWIEHFHWIAPKLLYTDLCVNKSGKKEELIARRNLIDVPVYFINHEKFRLYWDVICKGIDTVIIDESSLLRNNKSGLTRAFIKADQKYNFKNIYPLSGLPAPNNPHEYFNQIRLVDKNLLGTSFEHFLSTYFRHANKKKGEIGTYILKNPEQFMEKLKSVSIYVDGKKEDLPKEIVSPEYFELNEKQRKYYDIVMSDIQDYVQTHKDMAIQSLLPEIAKTIKALEIICGFYINNTENKVVLVKTELYNTVYEFLRTVPKEKVLIGCNFDIEQNIMVNYLVRRGHSVAFITGSHSDKERQSALNAFLNGNVQYLVAKMKVLKYSINLPTIDYCITTSLTHSFDDYDQFKGRIKRATGNQEHRTVFQIPMIAENTVAEPIFKALENKEDVSQAVLNYLLRN